MLDAELFVDLAHLLLVAHWERQNARLAEDVAFRNDELDIARRHARVAIDLVAHADRAGDRHTGFASQVRRRSLAWINDELADARAVAQINEHDTTKIAHSVHPSVQNDGLPVVAGADISAPMCTRLKAHGGIGRIPAV